MHGKSQVADAYLHNGPPTKMRCTIVQREHKKMGVGGGGKITKLVYKKEMELPMYAEKRHPEYQIKKFKISILDLVFMENK